MRSTLYWLTSTLVALLCMKAAATPHVDEGAITASVPTEILTGTTEPIRAILLGAGIMAVAFTYRCVWLNFAAARK